MSINKKRKRDQSDRDHDDPSGMLDTEMLCDPFGISDPDATDDGESTSKKPRLLSTAECELLAKCQLVRQWAMNFDWVVLDRVPVYGGDEQNLLALGRQVQFVLDAVEFPKGILILNAALYTDDDRGGEARAKVQLDVDSDLSGLAQQVVESRKLKNWYWSPELVRDVTGGCFDAPLHETFLLVFQHAFPAQYRRREDMEYPISWSSHNLVAFAAFPDIPDRNSDDDEYDDDDNLIVCVDECPHCVGNIFMTFAGVHPSLVRIVVGYLAPVPDAELDCS